MKLIDIYIKNTTHKTYDADILENTELQDIIISKIQLLIFTNKGEILGDSDFGCDIPKLLWQTNLRAEVIETEIQEQIATYIPELRNIPHEITFAIIPGSIQDIGVLNVNLNFTSISAMFK